MAKHLSLKHDPGGPSGVAEILNKPISQEMLNRDLARLAYVAKDGTPRVVPIAITWNGSEIVMCTSTNAPKLASLRRNPAVALTIDTDVHPPTILLIRGEAVLDEVEGIPDEYLQASGTYTMTPEQRVAWEAEVRSLYESMVRIVVKPTWAKLIDSTRHCLPLSRNSFADGTIAGSPCDAREVGGGDRNRTGVHALQAVSTGSTHVRWIPDEAVPCEQPSTPSLSVASSLTRAIASEWTSPHPPGALVFHHTMRNALPVLPGSRPTRVCRPDRQLGVW